MYGIASPVRDASGRVVAALGLSGPRERFKATQMRGFAPLIVSAALQISERLGARESLPVWR